MRSVTLLLVLAAFVPAGFAAGGPDSDLTTRVEALVARLGSDSYADRRAAYRELEALGRRALPVLRKHVEDEDPEIARRVQRLLRQYSKEKGDELLEALGTQDDSFSGSKAYQELVARGRAGLADLYEVLDEEDARYPSYDYWRMKHVYEVLAEIVDERDLDTLLARLNHPNPQQRYLLAPVLRKMDRTKMLAKLVAVLSDPKQPPLERAQILELSRDSRIGGGDERFGTLARRLLDDPAPEVRAAAVDWYAMNRRGSPVDRLVAAVSDDSAEVRIAAIRALANQRTDAVREALKTALSDPVPEVRASALQAIRNQVGPDAAPLLRPFLKDADPLVRSNAAQTLAQLGDAAALPALVALLSERDEQFINRALPSVLSAIGLLGDRAALPPLFDLLDDSVRSSRIRNYQYLILATILRLGGAEVLPRVRSWITSPELQNRQVVLDALSDIDSKEVVPILTAALANGTTAERTASIRGLVKRRCRESAPAILQAISSEDEPWFLSEAVRALVSFDYRPAGPALEKLLSGDPNDGRNYGLMYALIRAMVRFDVGDSAPRIAAIVAANPNFRSRGIDALGRLGNRSVVPALETMLAAATETSDRFDIALALARLGRPEPLAKLFASPDFPAAPLVHAEALIALDRGDEARAILAREAARDATNGNVLYNVACFYARLGDLDRAVATLRRALAIRPMNRAQLESDPDLDPLRENPGYSDLLKKIR